MVEMGLGDEGVVFAVGGLAAGEGFDDRAIED